MPRPRKAKRETVKATEPAYIRVRVTAGARRDACTETKGVWKVLVREKAQAGAANDRMTELLASALRVRPAQIQIVKGRHSPSKLIIIR